jgi:hypothetical protein
MATSRAPAPRPGALFVTRLRRRCVVATVVALVVCGCTSDKGDPGGGAAPGKRPTGSASARTPSGSPAQGSPDGADWDAITSAGIRIVAPDGSTARAAAAPATGVEVTVDEVSSLLAQAHQGSGTPGTTLDGLGPSDIPMSALLAAYARGVDTPAAKLAAGLLAPQDLTHPQTVVFPELVPLLFASDMAHASGDQSAESLSLAAYHPLGGVCSDVTGALYKGIDAIFDALHVEPVNLPKTGLAFLDGLLQGLADMVVDGINFVVEAGRKLVIGLVEYTLGTVLDIVAKVAALAAMVANFGMLLSPVHVQVVTDKSSAPKGVAPDFVRVRATASAQVDIGLGKLEWPEWFEDCARVAGAPLPPLKPVGEKIDWSIASAAPDLLFDAGHPGSPETVLRDGGPGTAVATWELVTGTEPADAKGDQVSSVAVVKAVVERKQVAQLRETLVQLGAGLLTGNLPPIIRGYLHDALVGAGRAATEGFVKLLYASGWKAVEVTYHEPGGKPPGAGKHEVWQGTFASNVYPLSGTFVLDIQRTPSAFSGTLQVQGSDCLQGGTLRAQVHGEHVEFGLVVGGRDAVTFVGTLVGGTMSGRFSTGPDCGSDKGSWEASLR